MEAAGRDHPGSRWHRDDAVVWGVLVEKAKTTPEYYPLTVAAIVTGCNQKSNRDPVTNYDPDDVEETLHGLRKKGAVILVEGGGRVARWKHTLYDWLKVSKVELAVMAELLLRGPQTEGELRARASRMEPLPDLAALQAVLEALAARALVSISRRRARSAACSWRTGSIPPRSSRRSARRSPAGSARRRRDAVAALGRAGRLRRGHGRAGLGGRDRRARVRGRPPARHRRSPGRRGPRTEVRARSLTNEHAFLRPRGRSPPARQCRRAGACRAEVDPSDPSDRHAALDARAGCRRTSRVPAEAVAADQAEAAPDGWVLIALIPHDGHEPPAAGQRRAGAGGLVRRLGALASVAPLRVPRSCPGSSRSNLPRRPAAREIRVIAGGRGTGSLPATGRRPRMPGRSCSSREPTAPT